jgi:co-chaperonin GroES (HSP10)
MDQNKKMTREEIMQLAAYLKTVGVVLYGQRVGVIRDDPGEYVEGSKLIVAADTHKTRPKTGTVVMIGLGLLPEEPTSEEETLVIGEDADLAGLALGDHVITNVYNTLQVKLPGPDGESRVVDVFHAADIYIGHRHSVEVELA